MVTKLTYTRTFCGFVVRYKLTNRVTSSRYVVFLCPYLWNWSFGDLRYCNSSCNKCCCGIPDPNCLLSKTCIGKKDNMPTVTNLTRPNFIEQLRSLIKQLRPRCSDTPWPLVVPAFATPVAIATWLCTLLLGLLTPQRVNNFHNVNQ